MSQKEAEEALELLLDRGLIKFKMVNGRKMVMLTKKGLAVANELKQDETSDYID